MTTALYRRYRPETFADVIGQEHVTEPLMAAIAGQRVSHAYLFSGPRGCGKTTSARILARCLNCAQGPTPTPCGECDSCRELARGGPGSLDVVEIDAASHNGVDDARELRERAVFAPARDRFKIFILDEAHMVTAQGFNALLKLVEEPPEHVKFVFATTEPEKVIGTIRSRTHHYPFRLVPPEPLQGYLEQICRSEGVEVGAGVLPLVVRAGAGSVRDSLSVLDQLLAGADGVLDYAQAVALLGYTPATLLDDVVEALAAADGASVFRVVDRVIESGHDPRRFVEDVLERLRDLIVIVAAGDRAADVLRGVPEDQLQRMRVQAEHLGLAQLSRAADLTNAALTEMTGATSPRLQLELLCARLLLPAADESVRGYGARIERLEQRLSSGAPPPTATRIAPSPTATRVAPPPTAAPVAPTTAPPPESDDRSGPGPGERQRPAAPPSAPRGAGEPTQPAEGAASSAAPRPADGASGTDSETLRRRWPEVLDTLSRMRRTTWILVSQNAQIQGLSGNVVRLRFDTPGIASTFRSGPHAQAVQRALHESLGLDARVEAVVGDSPGEPGVAPQSRGSGGAPSSARGAGERGTGASRPDPVASAAADWADPGPRNPAAPPGGTRPASRPPFGQRDLEARASATDEAGSGPGRDEGSRPRRGETGPRPQAYSGAPPTDGAGARAPVTSDRTTLPPEPPHDDEPDFSDEDLEESYLVGAPLVEQVFGATVIDDIPVDPAPSTSPDSP